MSTDPREDPREDRVRALLAGLPAETPPAEVTARLDDTLERLARERPAGVVPLDERRSARRRVPRIAVAAAAAVVLLGGGAVAAQQGLLISGGDSSASAGSSASRADASATDGPSGDPGASTDPSPGSGARSPGLAPPSTTADAARVPNLATRTFATDVATLLRTPTADSGDSADSGARRAPGEDQGRDLARHQEEPGCSPPRTTPAARTRPVTLDGRPAVLVVGPLLDGTRTVTAWPCGSRTPAASTQVPATR